MITSLKLNSHCSHTLLHLTAGLLPLAAPHFLSSSLFLFSPLLKLCCSLSVPIYRQEWCHQLQLFFNNGGCQPLTFGMVTHGWCSSNSSCCICQWTVPSINDCCTLMATNPTNTPLDNQTPCINSIVSTLKFPLFHITKIPPRQLLINSQPNHQSPYPIAL